MAMAAVATGERAHRRRPRTCMRRGIISRANALAAACGVAPGMSCKEAAELLKAAPWPHRAPPARAEGDRIEATVGRRQIVCIDFGHADRARGSRPGRRHRQPRRAERRVRSTAPVRPAPGALQRRRPRRRSRRRAAASTSSTRQASPASRWRRCRHASAMAARLCRTERSFRRQSKPHTGSARVWAARPLRWRAPWPKKPAEQRRGENQGMAVVNVKSEIAGNVWKIQTQARRQGRGRGRDHDPRIDEDGNPRAVAQGRAPSRKSRSAKARRSAKVSWSPFSMRSSSDRRRPRPPVGARQSPPGRRPASRSAPPSPPSPSSPTRATWLQFGARLGAAADPHPGRSAWRCSRCRRRPALKPGLEFSGRTLLRVGVALYGARLTLGQLVDGGALPVRDRARRGRLHHRLRRLGARACSA